MTKLGLFGSIVRNQVSENSNVAILVRLDGPTTPRVYFGTRFNLEDLLECPVELVRQCIAGGTAFLYGGRGDPGLGPIRDHGGASWADHL